MVKSQVGSCLLQIYESIRIEANCSATSVQVLNNNKTAEQYRVDAIEVQPIHAVHDKAAKMKNKWLSKWQQSSFCVNVAWSHVSYKSTTKRYFSNLILISFSHNIESCRHPANCPKIPHIVWFVGCVSQLAQLTFPGNNVKVFQICVQLFHCSSHILSTSLTIILIGL